MNITNPELRIVDYHISLLGNKQCFFENCRNKVVDALLFNGNYETGKKIFNDRILYFEPIKTNYVFACKEHYQALFLLSFMITIHDGLNRTIIFGVQKISVEDIIKIKECYIICSIIKKFIDVDINNSCELNDLVFKLEVSLEKIFNISYKFNKVFITKKFKNEFKYFSFPLTFNKNLEQIYHISNLFKKFIFQLIKNK
jgi:hypothetical protein